MPLTNGRVYWFATIAAPPIDLLFRAFRINDLQRHFSIYSHLLRSVLELATNEGLIHGDILDRDALPCYAFGRVLLIGDAAHSSAPNPGQGVCQEIEGAVVLAHTLQDQAYPERAFAAFERVCFARTHSITLTSRRIGAVVVLWNPVLAALRNGLLRLMPPFVSEQQMERLVNVRFEPLVGSSRTALVSTGA